MKKRMIIVSVICVLLLTAIGITVASSSEEPPVGLHSADIWAMEQDALKAAEKEKNDPVSTATIETREEVLQLNADTPYLDKRCYELATEEQKEQLDNIDRFFEAGIDHYPKQMLLAVGALPEDTPYLTLEQAKEICAGVNMDDYSDSDDLERDIRQRFNQITGAPDYDNGEIATYMLDENYNERISIYRGQASYRNDQTGESEILLKYEYSAQSE